VVLMPSDHVTVNQCAREIARAINADKPRLFRRDKTVVTIEDGQFAPIQAIDFGSYVNHFCMTQKETGRGGPKRMTTSIAKEILACRDLDVPKVHSVYKSPIIVESDGVPRTITGYDEELEVYCFGDELESVGLDEAVEMLLDLISEFEFTTPADKSRAVTMMFTPALKSGGHIPDFRTPIDVAESDKSQSGKGVRQQITASIYGEDMGQIAMTSERAMRAEFDSHVIAGRSMIQIDNLRGKFGSQKLESFLTQRSYTARAAYTREVKVDPRRTVVMLTTNGAKLSKDLANRSCFVRILKQEGRRFRRFKEGSIIEFIEANQSRYLGAIHAVVRAWIESGKQRTDTTEHDFVDWAQISDWIVQELFHLEPLLGGHKMTAERSSNKYQQWGRDVCVQVSEKKKLNRELSTSDILEVIEDSEVENPKPDDTSEDQGPTKREMGKRFRTMFDGQDEWSVDRWIVTRRRKKIDTNMPYVYKFTIRTQAIAD